MLLIQGAISSFQLSQIIRYEEHIAPFMPTMGDPHPTSAVANMFDNYVILGPALMQFILVPTTWIAVSHKPYYFSRPMSIGIYLGSTAAGLATWLFSFIAFVQAASTFD